MAIRSPPLCFENHTREAKKGWRYRSKVWSVDEGRYKVFEQSEDDVNSSKADRRSTVRLVATYGD